jgi:hypothetical protein
VIRGVLGREKMERTRHRGRRKSLVTSQLGPGLRLIDDHWFLPLKNGEILHRKQHADSMRYE